MQSVELKLDILRGEGRPLQSRPIGRQASCTFSSLTWSLTSHFISTRTTYLQQIRQLVLPREVRPSQHRARGSVQRCCGCRMYTIPLQITQKISPNGASSFQSLLASWNRTTVCAPRPRASYRTNLGKLLVNYQTLLSPCGFPTFFHFSYKRSGPME